MFKQQFSTAHLLVRPLQLTDSEQLLEVYSDQEVFKFDTSEPMNNKKEAETFIEKMTNPYLSHQVLIWAILKKENRKIIGTCGFKNWDRLSNHAQIGGLLSSNYWGQGFATELIPALCSYGFEKMQLNKIYVNTLAKNKAVLALMEKFHFQKEGLLKQHQFIHQMYEDIVIYSKIRKN